MDISEDPESTSCEKNVCGHLACDELAKLSCTDCRNIFCTQCLEVHQCNKHQFVAKSPETTEKDRAQSKPEMEMCEPCSMMASATRAEMHCRDCEENLCRTCSNIHKTMKATKSHIQITINEFIETKEETVLQCQQCFQNGHNNDAHKYCTVCEELLCHDCIKIHTSMEAISLHKLVNPEDGKDIRVKSEVQKDNLPGTNNETPNLQKDTTRPGTPRPNDIKSDSISLEWERPLGLCGDEIEYQIRFKEEGAKRWAFYTEQSDRACIVVKGLKAKCRYMFQVRSIVEDIEGPYSTESKVIETKESLASKLLAFTTRVKEGMPSLHHLHSTEIESARNTIDKTRKFELGKPSALKDKEKTILLVGATGSGKSTLVDGIINYITGVNWKDPHRFTLVNLEEDEKDKNQAVSQTEWVTCYTINPEEGGRLNYRLKIIDTPGFGDTRGLARDNKIVAQLKALFSSKGDKGVVFLDSVCFLMKAPDARLTPVQKYIFMSILSLFGRDIEENMCCLITFADGEKPPVLAAMEEAQLPISSWYVFNNSGLFAENGDDSSSLAPMFWKMGNDSFEKFFNSLDTMTTKSLQQTGQVLHERERLGVIISNLQPQIDAGLNKQHELKQEIDIFQKHKRDIQDNKDFEYEVEETHQTKTALPKGIHVTNCLHCNKTCHDNCAFANDDDKRRCCVMDCSGNCTSCDQKCHWKQHHNTPYIFSYHTKRVKKTYAEKLKMYQKAGEEVGTHGQVIDNMVKDLKELKETVKDMMDEINECNNTLKVIALHPHPLTIVEHLNTMINSEKMEKRDGFLNRIRELEDYKKKAEIQKDVDIFNKRFVDTSQTQERISKRKESTWSNFKKFFSG